METVSVSKVLKLFNLLSKSEQLEITDRINKQTFAERWQMTNNKMPDSGLSDDDIMEEVRAVRYGSKTIPFT
jgi:hypothetical protein